MPRLSITALAAIVHLSVSVCAFSQQPLNTELLVNGGFENGTTGWTVTGSVVVGAYGGGVTPSTAVAAAIGNLPGQASNLSLVRDGSANARLRQTFDLTGNAATVDAGNLYVELDGCLGGFGGDGDYGALQASFQTAGGGANGTVTLGPITETNRNLETVVMRRRKRARITPNTRTLIIDVQFAYLSSANGGPNGLADNLRVKLLQSPTTPARTLGAELLVNGDFEGGSLPGSLLSLGDPDGWIVTQGYFTVPAYGASAVYPPALAGAAINGGTTFIDDEGGNSVVRQTIDVSGNATAIAAGQLSLSLSACLGGIGADPDQAQANATFLDSTGAQVGSTGTLGPVTAVNRNSESILMRRDAVFAIPPTTRSIQIEVANTYASSGNSGPNGAADNIRASLINNPAPIAQPIDTNLVTNEGFDNGWTNGSFLTPGDPQGWIVNSGCFGSVTYGGALTPALSVAAQIGGGGDLVVDGGCGGATMSQSIDLRGNAAAILAGTLRLELTGFLGGLLGDGDSAQVNARFLDVGGAAISTATIGPITATNRLNQTVLMKQTRSVVIPPNCERVQIQVQTNFVDGSNSANGMLDKVSATLRTAGPAPKPYGTELLVNRDFETGNVLTIDNASGWFGTAGICVAGAYGGANFTPPVSESVAINGGNFLLQDFSGNGTIEQTIDLTGNAATVDQGVLSLHGAAHLGGYLSDPDSAQVNVRFRAAGGAQIGLSTLGPVTPADRGNQTRLEFRQGDFPVPIGTRAIGLEVHMNYISGAAGPNGMADNLSAVLFNTLLGGAAAYPGTGEDFLIFSGINGGTASTGPGYDIKTVHGNDIITIRLDALTGGFDFSPIILGAIVKPTTGPFVPTGGGIALDLNYGALIVIDGTAPGIFGAQLVLPFGNTYNFVVPIGFAGQSVLLEAFALPILHPPGFNPALPVNGLFASTDAHEFRIL